jgi:predicted metal-dependent hydrolase
VQLDFFLRLAQPQPRGSNVLLVGGKEVVVRLFPNRHARRYILRLSADGSARVTVPRGGSRKAALDFAQRHVTWIEQQLQKRHAQKMKSRAGGMVPKSSFAGSEPLSQLEMA